MKTKIKAHSPDNEIDVAEKNHFEDTSGSFSTMYIVNEQICLSSPQHPPRSGFMHPTPARTHKINKSIECTIGNL